jgi:Tfp pilus assembly protein PilZ
MATQPEYRSMDRFYHESIIMIEDESTQIPYYAVSNNFSDTGMVFKSLFEINPGAQIFIRIDDYASSRNPIPAKVVWCNKLKSQGGFRYGVGVEFLPQANPSGSGASLTACSRKTPSTIDAREGVAEMDTLCPEQGSTYPMHRPLQGFSGGQ